MRCHRVQQTEFYYRMVSQFNRKMVMNPSRLLREVQISTQKRGFQTRTEYEQWAHRMKVSRMRTTHDTQSLQCLKQVNARTAAPFLYSVSPISDRLLLFEQPFHKDYDEDDDFDSSRSPCSSMLECIYPLSGIRHHDDSASQSDDVDVIDTDDLEILRGSVSDLGAWSSFRLAKFYSDVDALTADVAYRHASSSSNSEDIAFVTAGHYYSRKFHRTDLCKDLILRCYPTQVGTSSVEVRTDALQEDENGVEKLINVCFTSMVAVDKQKLRPVKGAVPKLSSHVEINHENEEGLQEQDFQRIRAEMATQHAQIRKKRFETSMQLRNGPSSSPPTQQEMKDIHSLHQRSSADQFGNGSPLPHVHQYTYRSSVVVYPEKRNVHGKLFGGFIMEQGHALAQYAADFYLNHSKQDLPEKDNASRNIHSTTDSENSPTLRAIPLGLDEAIFLQPISIGDHVTFTARVVHSTPRVCRIVVIAEVRKPSNRNSAPLRSNRLLFLFGGNDFPDEIVPDSYREILMHVDSKRRVAVEGPLDTEVDKILNEVNASDH